MAGMYPDDVGTSDVMYTQQFEVLAREFYAITNKAFTIGQISPLIESMKQSKTIEYILNDPTYTPAIACLRNYVRSRPQLPQEFANRFVAVAAVKVNVMPGYLTPNNQTYVTKVIAGNVKPPNIVTNFTVNTMREQLRREIQRSQMHVRATPIVPQQLKLKLDHKLINACVNSISDLCKTIVEGNRANGRHVEPYIKCRIKYT